jgi:hypothetical protein
MLSVCPSPLINFLMSEPVFMKLGMWIQDQLDTVNSLCKILHYYRDFILVYVEFIVKLLILYVTFEVLRFPEHPEFYPC